MSKKSRVIKKARAELHPTGPPVMKVKNAGDVVTIIPYLLGFMPNDSLVVLSLAGPRRRFGPCFRLDLTEDQGVQQALVEQARALVMEHSFEAVFLVAFSGRPEPAGAVVGLVRDLLAADGVLVVDAVRADGRRWWSYVCESPSCCDPAGTPYDADSARMSAEAVLAGLQRAPDRDALRGQFEPLAGDERLRVATAAADLLSTGQASTRVVSTVARGLDRPGDLSAAEVAGLGLALCDVVARDAVWSMMSRDNAQQHFDFWRPVMRLLPDWLMPPAGSLTAFAAWLAGNGVLASHAVERVLAVDPGYRMAGLILDLLERAISPAQWDQMGARTAVTCLTAAGGCDEDVQAGTGDVGPLAAG